MLAISGTLIAIILSGRGSAPETPTLAEITATAEARAAAATATQAAYTPTPIPIPVYLRERFDTLPPNVRDAALTALREGRWDATLLAEVLEDAAPDGDVQVGAVLQVNQVLLRIEIITTGEPLQVFLSSATAVTRYDESIEPEDLEPDELVRVVLHPENPNRAQSIEALGIAVP